MPTREISLGLSALVVLLAAAGCEEETEAPDPVTEEPEAAPAVEEPPTVTPAQRLMHGHFQRATQAREALIRGDVESAREDMNWLATHEEGDALPESLQPMLTQMQEEAAHFGEATTLTEAGQALARTLVRCGACHEASGGGFMGGLPPVPEGETTAAHMQRHDWAATRMWEALVTNDAELFQAGTDALEETSLHEEQLPTAENQPPERVTALAAHVHELGEEAAEATTPDARADIYGRYLATCAACHRLLGTGPAAPAPATQE